MVKLPKSINFSDKRVRNLVVTLILAIGSQIDGSSSFDGEGVRGSEDASIKGVAESEFHDGVLDIGVIGEVA